MEKAGRKRRRKRGENAFPDLFPSEKEREEKEKRERTWQGEGKETTFHGSFMFKERGGGPTSSTIPSLHSNRPDFVIFRGVISSLQRVPCSFE